MTAPLRVLFVHYGGEWIRGSESVLLDLFRLMDRGRIAPFLACNTRTLARAAEPLGVESFVLQRPTIRIEGRATRIEPLGWYRTVRDLTALVRRLDVELLYCQNGQPSQVAYYAGRRTRVPCLSHLHSFYTRRDIHLMRLTRVAALIFVSEAVRDDIARRARLRGTLDVVHNGVDLERFRPAAAASQSTEVRRRHGIPGGRIVIGQVGSLIRRKGVDLLVDALAALIREGRAIHLVLVGGGPEERSYREQVQQLGIGDHVTFTGDVAEPDVFYREVFDVNVLASRAEAFGLALIEGAASGLPLVGARTGGMPEVVREGVSGMLFSPGDSADLARCLRRLLDDPEGRLAMGRRAREEAEARFSLDRQIRRLEEVIERTSGARATCA